MTLAYEQMSIVLGTDKRRALERALMSLEKYGVDRDGCQSLYFAKGFGAGWEGREINLREEFRKLGRGMMESTPYPYAEHFCASFLLGYNAGQGARQQENKP